jgi:hypothetical protein
MNLVDDINVVDSKIEIETTLMAPYFNQLEPLPEGDVLFILETGHTFISGHWN